MKINGHSISGVLNKIINKLNLSKVSELISIVKSIPDGYLQYRLCDWGVKKSQIGWLIDQSFTKGRIENNIIDLTKGDVRWILENIYE